MTPQSKSDLHIAQPLTLKCGLTLPNRLVKASMTEGLADRKRHPTPALLNLYKHWADGGWGLVITGSLEVDANNVALAGEPAVSTSTPDSTLIPAFAALARACRALKARSSPSDDDTGTGKRTPTIVQINHAGRQSPRGASLRGLFTPPMAPSAIPLVVGQGWLAHLLQLLAFPTPREMTAEDIVTVKGQFARAARIVAEAGFDGIELHGAHGYLISQFLSASSNRRTDDYGGSPARRARFVVEVIKAVREATKSYEGFCVGIKLNSVDHQKEDVGEFLEQVRMVIEAGVDFIEVSGGSYEDPQVSIVFGPAAPEQKSDRTKAREAFFLEFAQVIRKEFPDVPLMVTGGFSTRVGMEKAVADGGCDLVGLARPAVLNPSLPNNIVFNSELKDQNATLYRKNHGTHSLLAMLGIQIVGAGMESVCCRPEMHC
ncbi:NADPH dehydrogenase [Canariomyces notabilis]|uniref:NADPH dehydrogenase n=1 Tax=Canariomyces notabilis TaxID=2074819 RepID=A0AAN6YUS3_9PEZI|nr:NADPH dehydrogenase [Canariomyces arenarius]